MNALIYNLMKKNIYKDFYKIVKNIIKDFNLRYMMKWKKCINLKLNNIIYNKIEDNKVD